MRRLSIIVVIGAVAAIAIVWFVPRLAFRPTGSSLPQSHAPAGAEKVTDAATLLEVPWEIAFLPGGDILATERPGNIRRIGAHPAIIDVPVVRKGGEGGLLGLVLHPRFTDNGFLYVYSTRSVNDKNVNAVERYVFDGQKLSHKTVIIDGIPGADYHDGGELAFGPDGKLYVTTGDASVSSFAQDKSSLAGKILRLNDDGAIPGDNPFGTAVWTYGHRNPQGIAWDDEGRMWATEHGRSGALSGLDELNLIEKGKNYGWPTIQGDEKKEGMVTPVVNSGPNETWAPSGLAYHDGHLYFAGLRGVSLYDATISPDGRGVSSLVARFRGTYGRLRAVSAGPDGALYVSTSNRDGRGSPKSGDDRIIRIPFAALR